MSEGASVRSPIQIDPWSVVTQVLSAAATTNVISASDVAIMWISPTTDAADDIDDDDNDDADTDDGVN